MLKNYIVSNFRALRKNKIHTFINIVGLSLGISCAVFVLIVVHFDLTFDTYHPNADRLFRVVVQYGANDEKVTSAGLPYAVTDAMRNDFPEVELATTIDSNMGDPVIGVANGNVAPRLFKEAGVTFVDPEYFKMFNYSWVAGNNSALEKEKSVVITQSVAKKFFGDGDAINKIVSYNGTFDLTVTGVVKDPPMNTNLPFRIMISNRLGADKHSWDQWTSSSGGINTYVMLNAGANAASLEKKMKGWHMKYFGGQEEEGRNRFYHLQALSDVHFNQSYGSFNFIVSKESLTALAAIGVLLLLTACINFINLNTVLIIARSREVGIRKVLGSNKIALVVQFLSETFFITAIAIIISVPLLELALNNASVVLGYNLPLSAISAVEVVALLCLMPFAVTLIAGLYPALSLASFQPVKALKNKLYGTTGGTSVRRTLIVVQLITSQCLVICSLIIVQQIRFFDSQPLGLSTNSVVEFGIPRADENLNSLKARLKTIPGVEEITMSNTGAINSNSWGGDFEADVNGQHIKSGAQVKFIDAGFLKTYHIALAAGRDIPEGDSAKGFLVNEALIKEMGIKNPDDALGYQLKYWGSRTGTIVGVVQSFHSGPLHEKIQPVIFMRGNQFIGTCAIRLQTSDIQGAMNSVEKEWKSTFPSFVFQYGFLDDTVRNFYENERRTSRMITLFSSTVVVISCIGLLGLVSFMASRKTKEVGIRKTLGATTLNIMTIFSREFVWLIGISFLLAAPAAWFTMDRWLSNFAFRFQPGILTFLTGILLSSAIVFLTVGTIAYRAAKDNPVNALRNE